MPISIVEGTKYDVASVTNSFMSILLGIAVDKGYIISVHQSVLEFSPDQNVADLDVNKNGGIKGIR